jgi:hypothetical protein
MRFTWKINRNYFSEWKIKGLLITLLVNFTRNTSVYTYREVNSQRFPLIQAEFLWRPKN